VTPEGFFLGTHHPHWLASAGVPLFVSRRRRRPLDGCTHKSCANCFRYALRWRKHVLTKIGTPCQGWLCF
jgi:hypothetical protein